MLLSLLFQVNLIGNFIKTFEGSLHKIFTMSSPNDTSKAAERR